MLKKCFIFISIYIYLNSCIPISSGSAPAGFFSWPIPNTFQFDGNPIPNGFKSAPSKPGSVSSSINRFLQTEHYKECCVQMQERWELWNGHVHAQKVPGVSLEEVQGDGNACWMWVLLTLGRSGFLKEMKWKKFLFIITHQRFILSACTHCTVCLLPWWTPILHSDMVGWIWGYWMSAIPQ